MRWFLIFACWLGLLGTQNLCAAAPKKALVKGESTQRLSADVDKNELQGWVTSTTPSLLEEQEDQETAFALASGLPFPLKRQLKAQINYKWVTLLGSKSHNPPPEV